MSNKLSFAGFNVLNNPFGVLFHPNALRNVLKSSISNDENVAVYQREDLFFSWDAAGKIYGFSEEELCQLVISARQDLKKSIENAHLLILTFGSAFHYVKENIGTVGNCHKAPQSNFTKELASVEDMFHSWQELILELKEINPELQLIFTVSPVRHSKDGLVENNRSKARLIELTHQLVDSFEYVDYFPSYEILIDELRDYRFYANDFVHPNPTSVDYIWFKFRTVLMKEKTLEIVREVEKLKHAFQHRSLHPGSEGEIKFLEKIEKEKAALLGRVEGIQW